MASTCTVCKGTRQIGTGSVSDGSTSLTSFTLTDAHYGTKVHGVFGRNVTISITQSGTHLGRSFNTRITADNGSGTLTLLDSVPFVGA